MVQSICNVGGFVFDTSFTGMTRPECSNEEFKIAASRTISSFHMNSTTILRNLDINQALSQDNADLMQFMDFKEVSSFFSLTESCKYHTLKVDLRLLGSNGSIIDLYKGFIDVNSSETISAENKILSFYKQGDDIVIETLNGSKTLSINDIRSALGDDPIFFVVYIYSNIGGCGYLPPYEYPFFDFSFNIIRAFEYQPPAVYPVTISGRVFDNYTKQPVSLWVLVRDKNTYQQYKRVWSTKESGFYIDDLVLFQTTDLLINLDGYPNYNSQTIEVLGVEPSQTIELGDIMINPRMSKINGKVISNKDNQPLSNAKVIIKKNTGFPFEAEAITDENGNYEIDNVYAVS